MLAKQTFITCSLNAVALRRSRFTPMSKVSSRSSYWVVVLCKRVVVNCQGDLTRWIGEGGLLFGISMRAIQEEKGCS